jgi:hypothetical protein
MDVLEAKSLKVENIVEILNRFVRLRGAPKFFLQIRIPSLQAIS